MSEEDRFSPEEKLKLSELHYEKAKEILKELEVLSRERLFLTLANRAYYLVFNASKSLLILYGKDPVSHKGVRQLLHLHFSNERELLSIFDELMEYRQKVDYDVFVSHKDISENKAQELAQKAKRFFQITSELRARLVKAFGDP